MIEIDLTKYKFSPNRGKLRKEIINLFLNEKPGTGRRELTSRYDYITKIFSDGKKVFLRRPANFNNGFDFTVCVSNTNFNHGMPKRASNRPTHENIISDLKLKKKENPTAYNNLLTQIDKIYRCKKAGRPKYNFKKGLPTELILECIKWLFAEQDVTYWNYSGRAMLYEKINEV